MLNKTSKLFIGKDIDRVAGTTAATTFAALVLVSTPAIADGEIVVLDKNKIPLAPGSTVSDSDVIFICQGTSLTYSYTDPAGSAITARKIKISDAIEGAKVRKYTGSAYVAKAEKVVQLALGAANTIVAGTEYVLRVVYKDIPEHPGQFTQTYRVIANATATETALNIQMAAKINAHTGRRVNATLSTSTIILTGREIPECCTALTDLDQFSMVDFDAVYGYVASDGDLTSLTFTKTVNTQLQYGSGNWEQIRDLEKECLGNIGVYNRTSWPVINPVQDTAVDSYYDLVIIEHDASYLSPDNQYRKDAPKKTMIALATASTGTNALGQSLIVVNTLNTWMASCPGAFSAITI